MKKIKSLLKQSMCRLFNYDSLILYEMGEPTEISSPVQIKQASLDNISDVLHFQEKRYVKIFKDFLISGAKGYLGYINQICIHRSWVIVNEGTIYKPHPYFQKVLNKDEIYIHYCETAKEARGKAVYPYVLSHIASEFPEKRTMICVNEKNVPSIKGVEKAGFRPFSRITVCVIFGIVTKKERYLKDEYINE